MNTANIVSLLHRVAHDAAEERRKLIKTADPSTTWSFNKNLTLMVNPEIKCPGCNKWWPTDRVWLVDEKNFLLRKAWTLDGQRLPLSRVHPHVHSDSGEICPGDFESASLALVGGLNRDSYYNSVATFLRKLGDTCEYANEELCGECENFNHIDNMYKAYDGYWTCNDCNPDREEEEEEPLSKLCVECEEEIGNTPGANSDYCVDCCCPFCISSREAQRAAEEEARELAEQEEEHVRE